MSSCLVGNCLCPVRYFELRHTNSDSCVLLLSGKFAKLSKSFVFTDFSEKFIFQKNSDWFVLNSDLCGTLDKKKREVKGKCKYKRAAQERKRKIKKLEVLASFVSSILQYMSC
jgi:hypothetical protein